MSYRFNEFIIFDPTVESILLTMEELEENIKVVVRVRDLIAREKEQQKVI